MGGFSRTASRALGGDDPIRENSQSYKTVTPNMVNDVVGQMMTKPQSQWPDLSKWGPNSLNLLQQRYREASRNDLITALKVAAGMRDGTGQASLSDIKNPDLAAKVAAAKISPSTAFVDLKIFQESLSGYQTDTMQHGCAVINGGRAINERSPPGRPYDNVTVNDAAQAADAFAHKPASQWPDISNWGQMSVQALRTDYRKAVAADMQEARDVLANDGKGIENIRNPALKAVLGDIHPGMSPEERDKISNRLNEVQTKMNAGPEAAFSDRLNELFGDRRRTAPTPGR